MRVWVAMGWHKCKKTGFGRRKGGGSPEISCLDECCIIGVGRAQLFLTVISACLPVMFLLLRCRSVNVNVATPLDPVCFVGCSSSVQRESC